MIADAVVGAERHERRDLLSTLFQRTGLGEARRRAEGSDYAQGLVPVVEAVAASPHSLWRPIDLLGLAEVVSVFNLNRVLVKTVGFDFAELVDRARVHRAVEQFAQREATTEEIAEAYWPPRTRAQMLKEQAAQVHVEDNKLSSVENLDAAFHRLLDMGLGEVEKGLRP